MTTFRCCKKYPKDEGMIISASSALSYVDPTRAVASTIPWIGDLPRTSSTVTNPPVPINPPVVDDPPVDEPPPPTVDPNCPLSTWTGGQYTPEYSIIQGPTYFGGAAGMRYATLEANAGAGSNGITPNWFSPGSWDSAYWDGTPYNYCGKSQAEFYNWIFPTVYTMRGLKQLYDQKRPFQDEMNPTILEIDLWNVEVIQHYRRLLGISQPVRPNRCLFLRANWSDEQKFTREWESYAGYSCSSTGDANHCGATFAPPDALQVPYRVDGDVYCSYSSGGAEGIFPSSTWTNIPWSLKMMRVIRSAAGEGFTGHGGPFVGRCMVGMSWVVKGKWTGLGGTSTKTITICRIKWAGYRAEVPSCPVGTTVVPTGITINTA